MIQASVTEEVTKFVRLNPVSEARLARLAMTPPKRFRRSCFIEFSSFKMKKE
jgi:hypothetical protein